MWGTCSWPPVSVSWRPSFFLPRGPLLAAPLVFTVPGGCRWGAWAIRPVVLGPKSLPLGGIGRQAGGSGPGSTGPGGDDHDDVLERRRLGLVAGRPDVDRHDRVLGPADL